MYALGQVLTCIDDLHSPSYLHPAFYGCFDWHSCVHAHWSLMKLINIYPNLANKDKIINQLLQHISAENIQSEVKYFERNPGFERMYGWAWLLKLATEIHISNHPESKILEQNLQPLALKIVELIRNFLPKLKYPIRCGTHRNTAFAMKFIYDYAETFGDKKLKTLVINRAKDYFMNDKNGPIEWEPSGYDFLSPCLEEVDIMRRVLSKNEFKIWINAFLPQLKDEKFEINVAVVSDRKDGLIGHLDGLNFSRSWCLYGIAKTLPKEYSHLKSIADDHINHSLPYLKEIDYNGAHWLGTFALLAQCESF